jgi:hypothetical protein
MTTFTAEQKLAAVTRELGFRRRVYARRVDDGKMTQEQMDREIQVFEAIERDYQEKAAGERLL